MNINRSLPPETDILWYAVFLINAASPVLKGRYFAHGLVKHIFIIKMLFVFWLNVSLKSLWLSMIPHYGSDDTVQMADEILRNIAAFGL